MSFTSTTLYTCLQVVTNMRILVLLTLCFAAVAAVPSNPQRIVGGEEVAINQYPSTAALLHSRSGLFRYSCGGAILNSRSILTAAQCTVYESLAGLRVRVGSSFANSGGVVHNLNGNIIHPSYEYNSHNWYHNDLCILRSATVFTFNDNVRAASIAGPNYNIDDFNFVLAVGWGETYPEGSYSEQLRSVELMVINQAVCQANYATLTGMNITENMLCTGWPLGGRDQCDSDTGSPVYHNNVVVGVFAVSLFCGSSWYPGINTRVSRYSDWIQNNAWM